MPGLKNPGDPRDGRSSASCRRRSSIRSRPARSSRRPAKAWSRSCSKNAIDARATRIDLSVERGGKDLVRVADNGQGMVPDDLLLAFLPHATSKLTDADDLFRIRTLGFRGEALAAISQVAKLRSAAKTRQAGAAVGSELPIEGGVFGPVKNCGCSPGTVMEVRNLFYNIPVRRSFLKSDMTESGHVADMFSRIALAHPEIHLTYRSGTKVVHDLPPAPGAREHPRPSFRSRAGRSRCSGWKAGLTTCSFGATSPTHHKAVRPAKGWIPLHRRAASCVTARSSTRPAKPIGAC